MMNKVCYIFKVPDTNLFLVAGFCMASVHCHTPEGLLRTNLIVDLDKDPGGVGSKPGQIMVSDLPDIQVPDSLQFCP